MQSIVRYVSPVQYPYFKLAVLATIEISIRGSPMRPIQLPMQKCKRVSFSITVLFAEPSRLNQGPAELHRKRDYVARMDSHMYTENKYKITLTGL